MDATAQMWLLVLGTIGACAAFQKVNPEPVSPEEARDAAETARLLEMTFWFLLPYVVLIAFLAYTGRFRRRVTEAVKQVRAAIVPATETRD
jgi:hypothetical protein